MPDKTRPRNPSFSQKTGFLLCDDLEQIVPNKELRMPSATFSVTEALELGKFILAAYDLFNAGDPPVFVGA